MTPSELFLPVRNFSQPSFHITQRHKTSETIANLKSNPRMTKASFFFGLVLLALTTSRTESYLTVRAQITPSSVSTTACSASFINYLQANLTGFVLSATHQIQSLSDFIIPSGLHLTFFNNATVNRRYVRSLATTTKAKPPCTTCTSAGCTLSCGVGVCNLCSSSRRALETIPITDETQVRERRLSIDWNQTGTIVTSYTIGLLQAYLIQNKAAANGCLGNPNQVVLNVTFITGLTEDPSLEQSLINVFGAPTSAPAPVAAPSPSACCSQSFNTCVNYCGTTQQQCSACSDTTVEWLPQGLPSNAATCLPRWSTCTSNVNGCCAGLSCVGDQYWKGCLYVPPSPPTPTSAPTPKPTGCCTQSFATCVNYCGVNQQQCQTCADQTVAWLPQGLPSNANTCIPRWSACTNNVNGCCAGLTCTGNQYYRGCEYA